MASGADSELALGGAVLHIKAWSATDVGTVRKVNEDSLLASLPVFLVADGMGGHALGDRASQTVVEVFRSRFTGIEPTTPDAVVTAISQAHEAVAALSVDADDARSVAGTTLTGVALVDVTQPDGTPSKGVAAAAGTDVRWMIFNVGDSRVYSWDGSVLVQLTVDHSAIQELLNRGLITPAQIAKHPQRNVITRAIGVDDVVNADVWLAPVSGRQSYLICSDGLTKELTDEEIAAVLRAPTNNAGDDPAEQLTSAALAAGGKDNVTVIVLEAEVVGGILQQSGTARVVTTLPESLEDTLPRNVKA
ncbi:MAG: protein phosphatase 2C domain-containing protein [Lacisediminihabitans sp.]